MSGLARLTIVNPVAIPNAETDGGERFPPPGDQRLSTARRWRLLERQAERPGRPGPDQGEPGDALPPTSASSTSIGELGGTNRYLSPGQLDHARRRGATPRSAPRPTAAVAARG